MRKLCFLFLLLLISFSIIAKTPERIISLAPSLTKNLYLLEAGDLIVGCTNYCTIQSDTDASIVASAIQVNYEKAFLLEPDLIIATTLTKTKTIDAFRKLGVEVLVFNNPATFEEICDQFIRLGEKIGKSELANQIIEKARSRVEELGSRIPENRHSSSIFMQIGANPLFTVVPGMFMHDFIDFIKTKNIAEDLTIGSINLETVLIRNPDIIIIVLMGNLGEDEKDKWERFGNISAVKNSRIYSMDADDACSPTPVSFVRALEGLIDKIYPL